MTNEEPLSHILESLYFPLRAVSITNDNTRYQYSLAVRDFGKFLGRAATLADLTNDNMSLWIASMLRGDPIRQIGKLAAITAKERAGRIATLWKWLAERGELVREIRPNVFVAVYPQFARPRVPETAPWALNAEQLRELFASAGRERGRICGIPAGLWWQSFLLFVLNSGERKTAALAVRTEWMDLATGCCTIPPHVRKGGVKTGRYQLWDKTKRIIAACLAAQPGREMVWPWERTEKSYYNCYDRILRDASLPVTRHSKTHALRVSFATWVQAFGGNASEALGHSDTATFLRHYNDSRYTAQATPDLSERFGLDVG